jgi:hypothetical protein
LLRGCAKLEEQLALVGLARLVEEQDLRPVGVLAGPVSLSGWPSDLDQLEVGLEAAEGPSFQVPSLREGSVLEDEAHQLLDRDPSFAGEL